MSEPLRSRRVTIRDIADRAGVSKGAVSYALNGRPGVSDGTRERILSIAQELGWYPNRAARALSAERADACGLVLARPAKTLALEPFFMEFIAGVESEVSARSFSLTIQLAEDLQEEIEIYRRWWGERRVDGVLVVDLRIDDPRVDVLAHLGLPAVVVGGPVPGGALPSVSHDEASVVFEAVRYLAALGHTRIGRVAGLGQFVHTSQRTEAFRAVAQELGLWAEVLETDYTAESGARATRQVPVRARPAHRDRLRQRPARGHRPRCRAAHGLLRARRPLDRGLGRLADQPGRASAAHRRHARHHGLRRRARRGICSPRSTAARPTENVETRSGELTPRGSTGRAPAAVAASRRPTLSRKRDCPVDTEPDK